METNSQMVQRSTVKAWLLRNAAPETLRLLAEDLANADANPHDRNMVNAVILELIGD